MPRVLLNLPSQAKRGEIIEIKTLIAHPMETGYRLDSNGATIPRDIINRFVCTYNGDEIFRAELFPAIAANPFIAFCTVATESGELVFSWTDDRGQTQSETRQITSNEWLAFFCPYTRHSGHRSGAAARSATFRL